MQGVGNRPGEQAERIERPCSFLHPGEAQLAVRRAIAKDAAVRRRLHGRAGALRADRERHHVSRDRCGGTARRACASRSASGSGARPAPGCRGRRSAAAAPAALADVAKVDPLPVEEHLRAPRAPGVAAPGRPRSFDTPGGVSTTTTWAPSVLPRGNTYVLYYTARHRTSGLQCIGRAVGTRP